jgi:hypothetical protein
MCRTRTAPHTLYPTAPAADSHCPELLHRDLRSGGGLSRASRSAVATCRGRCGRRTTLAVPAAQTRENVRQQDVGHSGLQQHRTHTNACTLSRVASRRAQSSVNLSGYSFRTPSSEPASELTHLQIREHKAGLRVQQVWRGIVGYELELRKNARHCRVHCRRMTGQRGTQVDERVQRTERALL